MQGVQLDGCRSSVEVAAADNQPQQRPGDGVDCCSRAGSSPAAERKSVMRHSELPIIGGVRQFGVFESAATYILRPGGYAVIGRAQGEIAIVSCNGRFYLPGGG